MLDVLLSLDANFQAGSWDHVVSCIEFRKAVSLEEGDGPKGPKSEISRHDSPWLDTAPSCVRVCLDDSRGFHFRLPKSAQQGTSACAR